MNWIWKFHDWYDEVREPYRFLLLLGLASPIAFWGLWVDTGLEALAALAWAALILGPRMWRHLKFGRFGS